MQTYFIVMGCIAAVVYAGAVVTIGGWVLRVLVGLRSGIAIDDRLGMFGSIWLGFVVGQGIASAAWLTLALAGVFYAWSVWIFCALGWLMACALVISHRSQILRRLGATWHKSLSLLPRVSWYFGLVGAVIFFVALSGVIALEPTGVDDALRWYLVLPRVVAAQHRLELLPFLTPYYGLHPLQVEMHWTALFAISNETAVAVWDYFCAISSLIGVGILARTLTGSRRVAVVAAVMMLSTPGFYYLIGGGKPDNAAAQYGIAAFVLFALWSELGRRCIAIGGLCVGWSFASRYTNVFLLPAFIVFPLMVAAHARKENDNLPAYPKIWATHLLIGASAVALALAPMLIKNWLLVGCPLAPAYGCQDSVWSGIKWAKAATWVYNQQGISLIDLLSYPVVWTFGYRPEMLGNVSPLFMGFLPLLVLYGRASTVRSGLIAGWAGLISVSTWWLFINRLFPYTRWVLLPLGLFAICLASAAVAAEQDRRPNPAGRWLMRGAVLLLLVFLLFQSRGVVYALRYVAGIDSRDATYQAKPGYDVAAWLNNHMQMGQRVALAGWNGYSYFVRPVHLMNSESAAEFQRLWQLCRCIAPADWTADFWKFYAEAGFDYTIVTRGLIDAALVVLPPDLSAEVAFIGRDDAVLKIARH